MKYLFLVNDFGNGNTIRCRSLINHLLIKGHDVSVFSDAGKKKFYNESVEYFNKKYKYEYSFSIKNMLFYFINVFDLFKVIRSDSFDRIIIDSDYHLVFLKLFLNQKVFAVNNSMSVTKSNFSKSLSTSFIIEWLDYFFHCIYPDKVIVPVFDNSLFLQKNFDAVAIWSDVDKSRKSNNNLLLIEGGSSFKLSREDYLFIAGLASNKRFKRLKVLGVDPNEYKDCCFITDYVSEQETLQENIDQASFLIIRGGLSSISDAIFSRLPFVVLPIKNHYEQYCNARKLWELYGIRFFYDLKELEVFFENDFDVYVDNFSDKLPGLKNDQVITILES